MLKHKLATAVLALFSTPLLAMSAKPPAQLDTQIVFTNSTPDALEVRVSGNATVNVGTTRIEPLATATLATLSRREGNTDNLTITLSADDYSVDLIQNTNGTGLSFGASTHDLSTGSRSGENIQRFRTNLGDSGNTLAFKGNNLGNGGSLTYLLQEDAPKPISAGATSLNVLSYNIWATTIFGSKEVGTRLNEMPAIMAGYDVLVLTEVFDKATSDQLLNRLRNEYPYQSGEIFKAGKLLNSGTRILSRWPFETEGSHIYTPCNGIQCAATRGVIYTKINKLGKTYNVFATHTQSSDDDANRNARLAQLDEMGAYIRSLNLPADEPVIMAGDFNVNKIGLPQDRDRMEAILSATEPMNAGHDLTFDSTTNNWATAPFREYLDYTLTGNDGQQPSFSEQLVFAPRSNSDALWGKWDLSDHYAVKGTFTYPGNSHPSRAAFPYYGDVVHLQTHNGHYMRAMSGGNSFISGGSDQIGTWESFTIEAQGNGKVALRARDGHYVGLDSYLVGTLKANKSSVGAGELFELVELGSEKIALKADNGRYLRADFGGGAGLSAGSGSIGNNQSFRLIRR